MRAGLEAIMLKVHLAMINKLKMIHGLGKRDTIGILLIKYKSLKCMALSIYLFMVKRFEGIAQYVFLYVFLFFFKKKKILLLCVNKFFLLCVNSCFKECPHPDEKQRTELSMRLGLESKQIKFWFQNRRTQMKVIC